MMLVGLLSVVCFTSEGSRLIRGTHSFDSCPNQSHTLLYPAAGFGKIYPTSNEVGVHFSTTDATLQSIYDHAVECEVSNVKEFLPGLANVVEGAGYGNVWLETQP